MRTIAVPLLLLGALGANANAQTPPELVGTWVTLNVVADGLLLQDDELSGATWVFRDGELVLQPAKPASKRTAERFGVRAERDAAPRAIHVTPQSRREASGWMIYERQGHRLRIGFHDGLAQRPGSFDPASKLMVVTLQSKESLRGGVPVPDPCAVLQAAGVRELAGGAPATKDDVGPVCSFQQSWRAVKLMLVPGVDRAVFDRQRDQYAKTVRRTVRADASVGPLVYALESASGQGTSTAYFVLKGDTLVFLSIEAPDLERSLATAFARRVLAAI